MRWTAPTEEFLYGEPIVPGITWAFGLDPE